MSIIYVGHEKLFTRCGKTKLSCGLMSGHMKFRKTITIRSHLQVATTATFCICSASFDFEPSFSIFEQTSSFEFHMQLGVQQQKAKVFFWAPSDLSVGATVSTGTKQTSMQECKTISLPWVGQLWLSRLTKTSKQCSASLICSTLWSHQRVAQSPVLLPTTAHQHVLFVSIVSPQFRHWLRAIREKCLLYANLQQREWLAVPSAK